MALLTQRRFLPLFITQFLGAFNDNLYRAALLLLIGFGHVDLYGLDAAIVAPLSLAIFILPFFLFSAISGALADRMEKTKLVLITKLWELVLMVLAMLALMVNDLIFLVIILAGLGLQSAVFGPVKFSIIPPLVGEGRLLEANGYADAGTFLAILMGTLLGSSLIVMDNGRVILSAVMIVTSIVGVVSALLIPKVMSEPHSDPIDKSVFRSTTREVKFSFEDPVIRLAIIGAAWVWLLGSVYLSLIPKLAPDYLKADEAVFTLMLVLFSVGVGVGSIATNKLLKGEISNRLTVRALTLIISASVASYGVLQFYTPPAAGLTLETMWGQPSILIAFALLFLIALMGGVMLVPLYTIMQHHAHPARRSRVMAANNIINSGFMAAGSVASAICAALGLTSAAIITLVGLTGLFFLKPLSRLSDKLDKVKK